MHTHGFPILSTNHRGRHRATCSGLLGILLLIFSFPVGLFGQQLSRDSSEVVHREFNTDQLNAYRLDEAFQYEEAAEEESTYFDVVMDWVEDLLSFRSGGTSPVLQIIIYIVIGILVGVAIYYVLKLAKVKLPHFFKKATDNEGLDYAVDDEDIHQMPINSLLQKAIEEKRYRMAVRLFYLRALKDLSDRGMIHWQPDKTNHDYINEIKPGAIQHQFEDLTLLFEYAWYGEFELDAKKFQSAREQFGAFSKQVKGGRA